MLVDFLVNSEETAQVEFTTGVTPTRVPRLIIGPRGSSESLDPLRRINEEVLFDRVKPAKAASDFREQLNIAIKQ